MEERAVEGILAQLYKTLHKLVGLHRQLLDCVRSEKDALLSADLKSVEEITCSKEMILGAIQHAETDRLNLIATLSTLWARPVEELSLENVIVIAQDKDRKVSEQLRTSMNALRILINRITTQNTENKSLVDNMLGHVNVMKNNVIGEAQPTSSTYTAYGVKKNQSQGAKLISKEI